MKFRILTLSFDENYDSCLQAYTLFLLLKEMSSDSQQENESCHTKGL